MSSPAESLPIEGVVARTKPPGPGLVLSLVTIGVGVVLAVIGAVFGVSSIVHGLSTSIAISPTHINRELGSGTYNVYVLHDSLEAQLAGPLSTSDVTVTSASGQQVPVTNLGDLSETITRGSSTYIAEVRFTIHTAGRYDVFVRRRGDAVFIARSFGGLARHAAGWFVAVGIGVLLLIAGIVLLIVGIARRSRARRGTWQPGTWQPIPAGGPPPGWYPDASQPGLMRWWDGTQWTAQTHQP